MIFEERQIEKNNFSSRAIFLFAIVGASFLAVLFQVFTLQVSSYTSYELAALNNKNYAIPVQPLRGDILDRKGHAIVRNEPTFDLITQPDLITKPELFLELIKPVIYLSESEEAQYLKKFKEKAFVNKELVLKKNLTLEEIARFNVRSFNFKNVFIDKRHRRISDYPQVFAHVLGYTSRANNQYDLSMEIPRSHWIDAELTYANGLIQGKTGLEETYNQHLSGTHGTRVYEINSRGRLVKTLEYYPPEKGLDLHTHLDIKAQISAANALGDRKGAVVAIDLRSGGINVLYSAPTYSVNKLSNGMSVDEFQDLIKDPDKPFFNRALQGRYPPASTIKPAIGMFGLTNQLINWSEEIDDPGFFTLPENGRIYRGWKKGGHNNVNLKKALMVSSNTYFFKLAYQSDMRDLASYFSSLGFGSSVCRDCYDEDSVFVPSPDWKYKNFNVPWFTGDTVNIGVGQGYLVATPMQLANYISILANKGNLPAPALVKVENQSLDSIKSHEISLSNQDWVKMHDALTAVIESDFGTARSIRNLKDFQVAGKSGTAELVSLDSKEAYLEVRDTELLRDHSIIIAFGPMPNPQYAVSVVIENGESGGSVAGPVAIEVLKSLLND
ncbi:penicillin-binding protein 2 [Gammaproteobacteria bacterium]|nr:penicillin-binding protein 2 [Gammaproteobacteria bacterium]